MIPNFDVENPFNITKATDFSNQEIAEYWVDFYTANGEDLGHYLNPNDLTPKYIIGSKGCGKTHLLRYFSFPLQKLRHNNDTSKLIKEDKYIGLNIDFGAITSTRMSGCNINDNQWNSIFGYYLELFSGIYLLDTLSILIRDLKITEEEEKRIVAVIKRTICYEHKLEVGSNVKEFRTYINDLKKNADYHINNAALIRSIDFDKLEIKFSPGDIFFKIPAILISEISQFKDLKFIFILDELERLRDYQKIYVNTLVWDKKRPTTFWIGARTFGFTTRQINNGEVLRNGSEYQEIRLDEIMREDEERYKTFATNLCAKRLSKLMTLDLKEEKEI